MTFQTHFEQLDRILTDHRALWQFRPFALMKQPWHRQHPALTAWLDLLSEDQILHLEADSDTLFQALEPFLSIAGPLAELCLVPAVKATTSPVHHRLNHQIPGRKWAQISAFAAAIGAPRAPVLEWCAGKGHLGRLMAHTHDCPVSSVEIDPLLCQQGKTLAERLSLAVQFECRNVLDRSDTSLLNTPRHALALHACGELHLELLRQASSHRAPAISLSPCCYHLIESPTYLPLSAPGQQSQLQLDHHDLRLPLQETVTAGLRVRKLRKIEVSRRLGFDLLQRDLRGIDNYLPLPNVRKSLLNESFESFCHWAFNQKQLACPAGIDYSNYATRGLQRYLEVRRMELVRHLFRRPLELWLVLDRALFLQQQGYRVEVREFCQTALTPRNLLIHATTRED